MTGQFAWRVGVALVLAALAGPWLGSMMLAIKATGNGDGAVAVGVFGVAFIAVMLVTWAIEVLR